jgi:hypothetical protein
MRRHLLKGILFLFLGTGLIYGQTAATSKKQLKAFKITERPKIDGVLDEYFWSLAPSAIDFIQSDPVPGGRPYQQSDIRVLYDDNAIYIGAILYDTAPDSILKELSPRDEIANTDWLAIQIDTYKAGQLAFEFIITPSGIQIDRRITAPDNFERSWDAVWISSVNITDEGWIAEIEIPYSALRFPKNKEQEWFVNFGRYVRRVREESWWNEKRPEISNTLFQNGILTGISDINSPPRISATPFIATYTDHDRRVSGAPWRSTVTGGMDLKLGLSDAFTLDMALIPDFGQVRFDDQVLNLSPFEIQFEDNRPFFTEGTELFNRSDLFYTRRIGERPFYANRARQLPEGATLINAPISNDLVNASKLSGRTDRGLGIGVFNAIENRTYATYETAEGDREQILINPLTNYNVLVFDQNLPNNSYASLVNTNVWREGQAYDANVTALEAGIRDKNNAYMVTANAILSQRHFEDNIEQGHAYKMYIEKTRGVVQYRLSYYEKSANFQINDLGFLPRNNERSFYARGRYSIFSPTWFLNRGNMDVGVVYERLHTPNVFYNFGLWTNSFFMTKDFFAFGFNANIEPIETFDYFEPRTRDFSRFYAFPVNYQIGGFVSTDYRKRFAYDINSRYRWFKEDGRSIYTLRVAPRFRVSDHFFFVFSSSLNRLQNEVGFVPARTNAIGFESLQIGDILFARRNQTIIDNLLSARVNFNPYHNITLRTRQYWTKVNFKDFHLLAQDGSLGYTEYTGRDENNQLVNSLTYNLFTVDLVYTWRFAPGSDIIIVWKNLLDDTQNRLDIPYSRAVGDIFNSPQFNSISFKLIYYLDYVLMKRQFG